jgi:hypothetical protein
MAGPCEGSVTIGIEFRSISERSETGGWIEPMTIPSAGRERHLRRNNLKCYPLWSNAFRLCLVFNPHSDNWRRYRILAEAACSDFIARFVSRFYNRVLASVRSEQ